MADITFLQPDSALQCSELVGLLSVAAAVSPLLIDVRSERRFRRGHIAGSHCIAAARLISGEPPEGEIILIAETGRRARQVIDAMHAAGYNRRVRYLGDGLQGWCARGLPLVTPAAPVGLSVILVPAFSGTGLILASALLSSLPLLSLGVLLLWCPWIEPLLESRDAGLAGGRGGPDHAC